MKDISPVLLSSCLYAVVGIGYNQEPKGNRNVPDGAFNPAVLNDDRARIISWHPAYAADPAIRMRPSAGYNTEFGVGDLRLYHSAHQHSADECP